MIITSKSKHSINSNNNDFLQAVINTMAEGVLALNNNGFVAACNICALEILGTTEDEILGTKPFDNNCKIVTEDGLAIEHEKLPSTITLQTGNTCIDVVIGLVQTQGIKWLKLKSTLLAFSKQQQVIISFSDITEQVNIKKELATAKEQLHGLGKDLGKSENKFFNAFNYSGIGIALVSIDGKWLDVNPTICKMLGYSREEFLSMTFQDITHNDDLFDDLVLTKKMIFKKQDSYQMEKRYFHKNGKIVWVLLSVSLVWKNDSTPDFFISQIMDITQAKELTQELQFKNKILETTTESLEKRMKQIKEFNHIVAHNLRGPAGTIHLLIDLIKNETDEAHRASYLNLISNSSEQFQRTLKDLMRLMQNELTNEKDNLSDFNETIERVKTHLMASIVTTKAIIKTHIEVNSIAIQKAFLESIIYNLLSNAIKYSKRNVPPIIEISATSLDDKIQLAVKDNGIGIDLTRYGADVFKLNKTFHSGYDSKGIGLYITKNQVENAGGTIQVDSEPGKGSTFKVIFQN